MKRWFLHKHKSFYLNLGDHLTVGCDSLKVVILERPHTKE